MNDELRERLAALDPVRGVVIDPVDSDRARTLLEAAMNRPLTAEIETHPDDSRSPRRWPLLAGVVGLAAAAVVAVAVVAGGGDDSPATPPLALSLAASDTMAMCMPVEVGALATAEVALAGTVSAVTDGVVAIDVDRWYRGGDAPTVEVTTAAGMTVALDGVDFVVGQRYLVTASAGEVLICGLSGPATPELEALFDAAFAT